MSNRKSLLFAAALAAFSLTAVGCAGTSDPSSRNTASVDRADRSRADGTVTQQRQGNRAGPMYPKIRR